MKAIELKSIWGSLSSKNYISIDSSLLKKDLEATVKGFEVLIKKRNRREYIALALVCLATLVGLFFVSSALSKASMALTFAWCCMTMGILRWTNTSKEEMMYLSALEYLIYSQKKMIKERKLVSRVLYWYILPPLCFEIMFLAGQGIHGLHLLATSIPLALISCIIYIINRRSVIKQFDPLIARLEQEIAQLERDDEGEFE